MTLLAVGIGLAFSLAFFFRGVDRSPTPPPPPPAASATALDTDDASSDVSTHGSESTLTAINDVSAPAASHPAAIPATTPDAAPTDDTEVTSTPPASDSSEISSLDTPTSDASEPPQVDSNDVSPNTEATPATYPASTNTAPPSSGLHVVSADEAIVSEVGSVDESQPYALKTQLTGWGAGVRYIRLTDYNQSIRSDESYTIQQPIEATSATGRQIRVYPFAARAIYIDGKRIDLETQRWEMLQQGHYRITIADGRGQPVLRITRRYRLDQGATAFELRCDQLIENLSNRTYRIQWEQYAQGDMPRESSSYMGDRRMVVAGYHDLDYNDTGQFIYTDHTFLDRASVVKEAGEKLSSAMTTPNLAPLWPNEDLPAKRDLVWLATFNRYFTAAVHRTASVPEDYDPQDASQAPFRWPGLDELFPVQKMLIIGQAGSDQDDHRQLAFVLATEVFELESGQSKSLDLSLYAGPKKNEVFEQQPYRTLQFSKLLVYSLGGPCAFCTFQWLAHWLLAFLKFLQTITFDWGVAIIVLVLIVRAILHPITKKSQIHMMKFGKQMQALQPEIEKLKKKYGEDKAAMQREQMKLMKEKGISYTAGALGCMPMFLQMPIWLALYSMLYFAIELRHEPAFYGLFQGISGGSWGFLGDLSSADNFIRLFDEPQSLKLIFITFDYSAINILPILMGVVFYFQQKLTSPPPANEQAAQQQKIMRIASIFLFPLMLYSAPSGLTLYILASTFGGIVDSYYVRKHLKEEEAAGRLFEKKPPKPGSLRDRIGKIVEAKQQEMMAVRDQQQGKSKGKSHKPRKRR